MSITAGMQLRSGSAVGQPEVERRAGAGSRQWGSSGASAADAAAAACRYYASAALASHKEQWSFSGTCGCTSALQHMQPCSLAAFCRPSKPDNSFDILS